MTGGCSSWSARCMLAVVLLALFTREPAGRFRHHDRAMVSKRSCNMADTAV